LHQTVLLASPLSCPLWATASGFSDRQFSARKLAHFIKAGSNLAAYQSIPDKHHKKAFKIGVRSGMGGLCLKYMDDHDYLKRAI